MTVKPADGLPEHHVDLPGVAAEHDWCFGSDFDTAFTHLTLCCPLRSGVSECVLNRLQETKVFRYFRFLYFAVKTKDEHSIIITINKINSTCIARQHVTGTAGQL